jgi:hypothetical protein
MTTLREMMAEISPDALDMQVEGVAIVLCSKGAPLVIRTMPEDLCKELFKSLVYGSATESTVN